VLSWEGPRKPHNPTAREQNSNGTKRRQLNQYSDSVLPQTQGVVMNAIGFDKPLYILPFDQRLSLQMKMFGWTGALTAAQTAEIAAAKQVIYDGFKAALQSGVPQQKAGILVDEQFGAAILRDAVAKGYTTACSAEKSGQEEFDFEYGEEFGKHIEAFRPTFSKVLVRYNSEGDHVMNRRQAARLRRLCDYLYTAGHSKFLIELIVPPERSQLAQFKGDKQAYDRELRPRLMEEAIMELQEEQVEPDVWKVEGLDRREDCEKVVAVARRGPRARVGCIILGRGESGEKVRQWLTTAAAVDGFIGFAIGRTTFWDPLVQMRSGRIAREAAVTEISRRYREFVHIFEIARTQAHAVVS
jgi:myo-inositol catabolism protein IolC